MKSLLTLVLATVITVGAFAQDARPQRGQRGPQLTEKQQEIGKVMAEDEGIKKIRQKAIKDMIAYLVKKGYDKEDAKAVVEAGAKAAERFRSASGRGGNRQRPSGAVRPDSPRRERKQN